MRPRPKFWPRGQFGLEALTSLLTGRAESASLGFRNPVLAVTNMLFKMANKYKTKIQTVACSGLHITRQCNISEVHVT